MNKKRSYYQQGGSLYSNAGITTTGFIPTYAGEPIETVKYLGEMLKREDELSQDRLDNLHLAMADRVTSPDDRQEVRALEDRYRKELEDIVARGDYLNMQNQIRGVAG